MKYDVLHLKDYYDFLGKDNCDPTVEIYLQYNMSEMNREEQKRPCLVVCPGGGYEMCSQRESEPVAVNFLSCGFNIFVLNYSVSPHRFPTQMIEVAALMDLIYSKSQEWNCNVDKVSIIGFSAGGHLAAHYSTAYDCDEVRGLFPDSKPVNASILCYPVITAGEYSHMGSIQNLIGHKPSSDEEINKFSCEKLVNKDTPPAFLWHTAEDDCVPVNNSLLYAASLSKYKIPFELHIYPFGRHGLSTCDSQVCDDVDYNIEYDNAWIENAKRWIKMILKL